MIILVVTQLFFFDSFNYLLITYNGKLFNELLCSLANTFAQVQVNHQLI